MASLERCRRTLFVAGLLAMARAASADPAPSAPERAFLPSAEAELPPPVRLQLRDGLDVLLQEDHRQATVAIVVAYELGWRDDARDKLQLAHLVEHLSHTGSRHLAANDADELLQRAGAQFANSTTSGDYTTHASVLPAGALALGLWIERERMAFAGVRASQATLDHEKLVVASEARRGLRAEARFADRVREAMYGPSHPYSQYAFVTRWLENIQLADARELFRSAYRPDNAHLVVVGDFERTAAAGLVEHYFGSIATHGPRHARAPLKPLSHFWSHELDFEDPALLNEKLVIAWPVRIQNPHDEAVFILLAELLQSRLQQRLVERGALASATNWWLTRMDLADMLELEVELRPEAGHEATDPVTMGEIARPLGASDQARLEALLQEHVISELHLLESPLEVALRELVDLRHNGATLGLLQTLNTFGAVTLDDLRAAQQSLKDSERIVARSWNRGDP